MPKTRSGNSGAAAGPTTQAAIMNPLGSLRPEPACFSVPVCLYFCSVISPDAWRQGPPLEKKTLVSMGQTTTG